MNDDSNEAHDDDLEDFPRTRVNWISRIYNWMEKTHTKTTRLIAWVAYVSLAFILFGLSPVLALILVLIGIFRVEDSGHRLDKLLKRVGLWEAVEPILMVPLFGFYFLIALRFFEIDLGAINLRPISPLTADVVNFIGGSVLGFLVSRRSKKGEGSPEQSDRLSSDSFQIRLPSQVSLVRIDSDEWELRTEAKKKD